LVDPLFDDPDLFGAERASRRHSRTAVSPDQFAIELAVIAAAWQNRPDRASAVKPQAVHLLRRSVTANAICLEDGLNIAPEFDLAGWADNSPPQEQTRRMPAAR